MHVRTTWISTFQMTYVHILYIFWISGLGVSNHSNPSPTSASSNQLSSLSSLSSLSGVRAITAIRRKQAKSTVKSLGGCGPGDGVSQSPILNTTHPYFRLDVYHISQKRKKIVDHVFSLVGPVRWTDINSWTQDGLRQSKEESYV